METPGKTQVKMRGPADGLIPCSRLVVRTRKEDSAFLCQVLEAQEGLTAYSTLEQPSHAQYRDLELLFTEENRRDVLALLQDLGPLVAIRSE
jgi:hypothetical protein